MIEPKCIHRHSIKSHPNCFKKGLIRYDWWENKKIGFLDIETSGLKADFDFMLTWCIKPLGSDKIAYSIVTKKEIFDGVFDKRIVNELLQELRKYDIIVTYYGCLTPGHRILKGDLTWVPVETLKVGDELLAFDDKLPLFNGRRQYKKAVVTGTGRDVRETCELTLSDGTKLVSTLDHKWLVRCRKGSGGDQWQWKTASELKPGDRMKRLLTVWNADKTYDAGWLAGFFDGEGTINQPLKKDRKPGEHGFQITATQKEGEVLDKAIFCLKNLGFACSSTQYDREHPYMRAINILGGKTERLRFLGSVRPLRLLKNADLCKLGAFQSNFEPVTIVSVTPSGKQEIITLGTSAGTYIAEGFGSHNTGFDIPFSRARADFFKLDFPKFGEMCHWDLFFHVRRLYATSRKSLEVITKFLGIPGKTKLEYNVWFRARFGDPKAIAKVLDHNKFDVIILEKLYERIKDYSKWIKRPM